jgi:hypothetical protein
MTLVFSFQKKKCALEEVYHKIPHLELKPEKRTIKRKYRQLSGRE